MIKYRQISAEESSLIHSLVEAFCKETLADEAALALIIDRLSSGTTIAFIAEDDLGICGIAGYLASGTMAVADFFYVLPEFRGGIVGGKLYRQVLSHSKGAGLQKIMLMVTDDKESLYIKLGFKRKFILLTKEL